MKHVHPFKLFEASMASGLTQSQKSWLYKCTRKRLPSGKTSKWTFDTSTGLVDVAGNFYCSEQNLTDFKGVKFGVIEGDFYCSDNNLTSLEGAPQHVGGEFYCYKNHLTSLEGAPQHVGGRFYCYNNNLTSLKGAPQHVERVFNCSDNNLTSLEGAPQHVERGFFCDNNNLTSLEGAPQHVGRGFYCSNNPVSELVLNKIFELMGRMSYQKAVENLWNEIPVDDQSLLFRSDFGWIDPTERRKLEALASFNKIKGMI
jgi:hypothetical protein